VIGGSGYFDGSDYLAISNGGGSALDMGTGNCTIEMWVNPETQSTSFPSMFAPKTGWSSGTFYIRYSNGGNSKFGIFWNGVGDPFFESTNTYPPNAWYHVALVRSGTTFTLYVNGVSAGTGTSSATLNLAIGGEVWLGNNTSASCYFKGLLSDVRVVKGTAVYTSTFTPPTTPLTAISGTSLLTNMTNGAIYDNAMMNDLETVGNAQISTSVVKYGTGSLYFDGTGDYLLGATNPNMSFGAGDFTAEAWVYPTASSINNQAIFQKGRTAISNLEFSMVLNASNQLTCFYTTDGSTISQPVASSTLVSLNTWTHIAITRSGSTWRCFVNGTLEATATAAVTLYTGTGLISSGANPIGDNTLTGYIDELRITKGYARYTATFTPPTAAFPNIGPT
jgi:hypothetical protein